MEQGDNKSDYEQQFLINKNVFIDLNKNKNIEKTCLDILTKKNLHYANETIPQKYAFWKLFEFVLNWRNNNYDKKVMEQSDFLFLPTNIEIFKTRSTLSSVSSSYQPNEQSHPIQTQTRPVDGHYGFLVNLPQLFSFRKNCHLEHENFRLITLKFLSDFSIVNNDIITIPVDYVKGRLTEFFFKI